jgi:hypothetical protein
VGDGEMGRGGEVYKRNISDVIADINVVEGDRQWGEDLHGGSHFQGRLEISKQHGILILSPTDRATLTLSPCESLIIFRKSTIITRSPFALYGSAD